MKKTAIALMLIVTTAAAKAQTVSDALTFSKNEYEGTARTMAMGNAFTALGGDPGAVSINPAGSAVSNYSQGFITLGADISINTAVGTRVPGGKVPSGFEQRIRNSSSRFSMPTIGVAINFDTHRISGLKNINIGFTLSKSALYLDGLMARGTNDKTSFLGEMAYSTYGYDFESLLSEDAWYDVNLPWHSVLGVQSGMIANLTESPLNYVGATENIAGGNIRVGGPLNQIYGRNISGAKKDALINIAANFSDMIYVGANLGFTNINYNSDIYLIESAQDYEMFETGFRRMEYSSSYHASGIGVYGKFGVLVTPYDGLRIGAAFQTPTITAISEKYSIEGTCTADKTYSAESPVNEYSYRLLSPLRFNVGVAYTLGNIGLISVDYEMCDYSKMKFKDRYSDNPTTFLSTNTEISAIMRNSHMIRAGVEVKPVTGFAIRAGYGISTNPEKLANLTKKVKNNDMTFSFGLGYNSKGSFYADVACMARKYAKEYIMPYPDYIFDTDNEGEEFISAYSPEIENTRNIWSAVLTIGFRF